MEKRGKNPVDTTLFRSQHNTHSREGKDGNSISGLDEFLVKSLDSISGEGEQRTSLKQTGYLIVFQPGKIR